MDYYKILNKEECHHGLQYKTGLNIDPKKFRPSGDCKPGGIYFSKEDIFAFLDYGPWIRKVTLPEDVQIYENPGKPKKWKVDKVILGKREKINLKVIKRLIKEGANPSVESGFILRWAAYNGHTIIVKYLISLFNSELTNNEALRCAAEFGHINIVKFLIPISDPKSKDSQALRYAAEYGYIDVAKLLIPFSDPTARNNYALRRSAFNGHLDIVKLLIPVSEIDDDIIEFCKTHCDNQEIRDLIIANKKE